MEVRTPRNGSSNNRGQRLGERVRAIGQEIVVDSNLIYERAGTGESFDVVLDVVDTSATIPSVGCGHINAFYEVIS